MWNPTFPVEESSSGLGLAPSLVGFPKGPRNYPNTEAEPLFFGVLEPLKGPNTGLICVLGPLIIPTTGPLHTLQRLVIDFGT